MIHIEKFVGGLWVRYRPGEDGFVPEEAMSDSYSVDARYGFDDFHVEKGYVFEAAEHLTSKYGVAHRVFDGVNEITREGSPQTAPAVTSVWNGVGWFEP